MTKFLTTTAILIALSITPAFSHNAYNPCDEGYKPVEYIIARHGNETSSQVQEKLNEGYRLYGHTIIGTFIRQPMVKCGRK